ncbi:MAG: acetyl-CoA carboxylase biotin carboxyl carrier protein [Ruminiclostridium sp.]|nr:acetyl-CoA carboxylase biotin carboxyl carrier protein [Ruminiclostridium sp.]
MKYKDSLVATVKEYVDLMKESNLSYLKVKNDDFELELGEKRPPMPPMPPMMTPMGVPAPAVQANIINEAPAASAPVLSGNIVKSPIVGTFYAAPAPGKAPYVTVGASVNKGDVLFIIESMKLMNEVTSEFSGKVAEILVKDGEAVEFDQPILRIE